MREPDVGVVQTPQHFFNPDPIQTNSLWCTCGRTSSASSSISSWRRRMPGAAPSAAAPRRCCATRRSCASAAFRPIPSPRTISRRCAQGDRLPHRLSQRAAVARPRAGGPQGIRLAARPLGARLHADLPRAERSAVGQGRHAAHRARHAERDVPALVGDAYFPPAGARRSRRSTCCSTFRPSTPTVPDAISHLLPFFVVQAAMITWLTQRARAAADGRPQPASRRDRHHQVGVHRSLQAAGSQVPGDGQGRRSHEGLRAMADAAHLSRLSGPQRRPASSGPSCSTTTRSLADASIIAYIWTWYNIVILDDGLLRLRRGLASAPRRSVPIERRRHASPSATRRQQNAHRQYLGQRHASARHGARRRRHAKCASSSTASTSWRRSCASTRPGLPFTSRRRRRCTPTSCAISTAAATAATSRHQPRQGRGRRPQPRVPLEPLARLVRARGAIVTVASATTNIIVSRAVSAAVSKISPLRHVRRRRRRRSRCRLHAGRSRRSRGRRRRTWPRPAGSALAAAAAAGSGARARRYSAKTSMKAKTVRYQPRKFCSGTPKKPPPSLPDPPLRDGRCHRIHRQIPQHHDEGADQRRSERRAASAPRLTSPASTVASTHDR